MWYALLKEIAMLVIISILMGSAVLIAFWFGERNGISKERMNLISMLEGIRITEFAVDIQYGVSVAIGHICDKLREDK